MSISVYTQGLPGIFWSYPAVLMFQFMFEQRTANVLNATLILLMVPLAYLAIGPAMTIRFAATLCLLILFANIFASIVSGLHREL